MAALNADKSALRKGKAAAAVADQGALTSAAAVGATPTKAEFDKVVVDLAAARTTVNALLAALRAGGQLKA